MRIKVFEAPDGAALEKMVNDWLHGNETIKIDIVNQSFNYKSFYITLTIFYT